MSSAKCFSSGERNGEVENVLKTQRYAATIVSGRLTNKSTNRNSFQLINYTNVHYISISKLRTGAQICLFHPTALIGSLLFISAI